MERLRWMISEQRHLIDGVLQIRYQVLWRLGRSPKLRESCLFESWDEAYHTLWKVWAHTSLEEERSGFCFGYPDASMFRDGGYCWDGEDPFGQTIRARGRKQYEKEIDAYSERRNQKVRIELV